MNVTLPGIGITMSILAMILIGVIVILGHCSLGVGGHLEVGLH